MAGRISFVSIAIGFSFLFFSIWCDANLVMVDDCEVYKSDEPNHVECEPVWPSGKALGW